MRTYQNDTLTEKIIACCFKVHNELGAGFLEKIYRNALIIALTEQGLKVLSEKEFTVCFHEKKIGKFRCDIFVEDKVILELKAVSGKMPIIFEYQLLSYLKASEIKTGLLINFGNKSCDVRRLNMTIHQPNQQSS